MGKNPNEKPTLDKADLKLRKSLVKWGVSEEEADQFIEELKQTPDEEENAEITPEAPESPEKGMEGGEEPQGEEPSTEQPAEPTEQPAGAEVPPVDEVQEPVEPLEGQEPAPEAPVEPQEPTEQPASPIDYQAKYEELQKSVDGIKTRFDSLEEALQKSGVLMSTQPQVGLPSNEPQGQANIEGSNDDVLKLLNR